MPNLVTDGMRFQTTPDDLAINALISRMYGGGNIRGPYFYPRSPYALNGLGDLVPGQMPTQFGTMRVIPEAAQMLATSPPSTSSQDWDVPQSVGQDTGRYDMAQPAFASLIRLCSLTSLATMRARRRVFGCGDCRHWSKILLCA